MAEETISEFEDKLRKMIENTENRYESITEFKIYIKEV